MVLSLSETHNTNTNTETNMANPRKSDNGTHEPPEQLSFTRPAAYWESLLDHAAKRLHLTIPAGRYAPCHVCDMAKGRRVYPRLVASAVRKLYLEDIARQQGND